MKKIQKNKMVKIFRCALWGDIEISPLALSIIDTWEFQRLHYIKQTGFVYKVFPTATSSRFEHSIGVYHITKYLLNHIQKDFDCENQLSYRKREIISIIGLLHDIGHGPFSHLFDIWLKKTKNLSIPNEHEERSSCIFQDMVKKYNLDFTKEEVEWICQRIINPPQENWYDTLVNNPYSSFDTDKLDYLLRDTKHFGIPCNFDINRILQNCKVIKNKLCFCERIYTDIEKLFTIREELHQTIYRHPTVEKFQEHFLNLLEGKNISLSSFQDFLEQNDVLFLSNLPKKEWIELETRTWKEFHSMNKIFHYKDEQKKKAMENILWYKRKDPNNFFCKK